MAYNFRYRPTPGHPKPDDTVIVYFIDFDSYGSPSFGVTNNENQLWSVPDYIGAGIRSRDMAGVKDEDEEYSQSDVSIISMRSQPYWGSVKFDFDGVNLDESEDQYPNDLLKVDHLARPDNGELDWPRWFGSSFGSSLTYNYSVLNERYGTEIDPVEEDFQNLLYFLKENKPKHLKGVVLVPLRSKYSQSVSGQFKYTSPIFFERLRILKERIAEEELEELFVITEPQWTGENNTVSSGAGNVEGCCPVAYKEVFHQNCPFQFPSVDPTTEPDPTAPLTEETACSSNELETLLDQTYEDGDGTPAGVDNCARAYLHYSRGAGSEVNNDGSAYVEESFYGCKGSIFDTSGPVYFSSGCNADNCTEPTQAYDESDCICSGRMSAGQEGCSLDGQCGAFTETLEEIPECPNVSMDCLCSYSYQTPTLSWFGQFGSNPIGGNDFWRSPICSPFVNDFSQVIIDAVDSITEEDKKFQFIFLNNHRGIGDKSAVENAANLDDIQFGYTSYNTEGLPFFEIGGDPVRENVLPEYFYSLRNEDAGFTDIYMTINGLYDYYGSENAVRLKNNFMVGHMNEIRQRVSTKEWLYNYFEEFELNPGYANYKCWQYLQEVTTDNYKSLLKDTRGYGSGFFGSKCPHTLFQRPSERVKFFFTTIPVRTPHIQQGEKNFHRIPEGENIDLGTYVDEDTRYYDSATVIDSPESYGIPGISPSPLSGPSLGSSGVTQYGQFFLQHIISVITEFIIFTTSNKERFKYADKVCEMIYKQQRSPINQGLFTFDYDNSKDSINVPGDPGDFFNFNDEIYYDPYNDMRTSFIQFNVYEDANGNEETKNLDRIRYANVYRSVTGSLYRGASSTPSSIPSAGLLYPQEYFYQSTSNNGQGLLGQNLDPVVDYDDDHSALPPLTPSLPWDYIGFLDLGLPTMDGRGKGQQGSGIYPNKLYREPYPPPFDNYTENLTQLHEKSTPQDRWIKLASGTKNIGFGGNRFAQCNCWESSVLRPYLNIEGKE